jgi:hypothetical protein
MSHPTKDHASWCNYKHGRCDCGATDQKQTPFAAPTSKTSSLQRYDYSIEDCTYRAIPDGSMVRFEDVARLLRALTSAVRNVNIERREWYTHIAQPLQDVYQALGSPPEFALTPEEIAALAGSPVETQPAASNLVADLKALAANPSRREAPFGARVLCEDAAEEIERLREVIARCYLRLQAADVPREPWHWEVSTALDDTGLCSPPETAANRCDDCEFRRQAQMITDGYLQALQRIGNGPPPTLDNSEVAAWASMIARDALRGAVTAVKDMSRVISSYHKPDCVCVYCEGSAWPVTTEKASEPRELTASEAASFSKTLARSPRVLEKAGARPTPQQLGERHADTLRALAEDVCKCRGKLGWTRDESGKAICTDCRLPITHPEKAKPAHTCKHGNDWLACKLCDGEAVKTSEKPS